MANLKSQVVQDLDALRVVMANQLELGGSIREAVGLVSVSSSEGVGDVLRYVRLPSRARISGAAYATDGAGTTGAGNLGIYDTDDGAAVDADVLGTVDLTTASDGTDATDNVAVADRGKALWELAGESSDPNKEYDVAVTLTTGADAAMETALIVQYVLPE